MGNIKFFSIINLVLESLSKGSLVRTIMAFLFRFVGVANFIFIAYFFFKTISYAPDFWLVLLLLLLLVAAFFVLQIWFYRANKILGLEDSDFTVMPIFSHLFRAFGEMYALGAITIGLGGTLILWFSDYIYSLGEFLQYLPFASLDSSFIGGIIFLLVTILVGFLIMLVSYFMAEYVLVFAEIAKNTRWLKKEVPEEQPVN
jgi:hypothetical protein